ncbi:histidine phosphatase family protein [Barrientosiimonas humi]|uniref:histidine phosphatase family protein n=1 Tax=Barrientosiimonas humi TaxID=999931 RepID=UPI00370D8274
MSDLQCPVRVFLARHGEAAYETDRFLDHGGTLTPAGRAQARALGEQLRHERIAHVYSSTLARAVQTAELAAAALGTEATAREGLAELGLGDLVGQPASLEVVDPVMEAWSAGDLTRRVPQGETGTAVVARVRGVLDELADVHRGEAILVVSHGAAMIATLAGLVGRRAETTEVGNCAYAVLEGDSDGWRLVADLTAAGTDP